MKKNSKYFVAGPILLAGLGLALLIAGCSTATPKGGTEGSAGKPSMTASAPALSGGAELWARNCGHCHNIRSPSSYSDSQWDVVMMHMRVRANLTGDEHRKILAFLKTAH